MLSNRVLSVLALFAICAPCHPEELEGPSGFLFVLGPRVGASYVMTTPADFTAGVHRLYPTGDYVPVLSIFGISVEQRLLLGQTRSHFAFQEIVMVLGLEQGIALPEVAVLIGYRDFRGLEFGVGPILQLSGVSVLVAAGWTFSYRGVYVPLDISAVLPTTSKPAAIGLTTGFNFQVGKKSREN